MVRLRPSRSDDLPHPVINDTEIVGYNAPMSDDFQTARLYVEVKHRPEDGAVTSSHGVLTDADQTTMNGWVSGGLVQSSNALFIEYLRQESYVMALTRISQDGRTMEDLVPEDLQERVRKQTLRILDHIGLGIAEETLQRFKA